MQTSWRILDPADDGPRWSWWETAGLTLYMAVVGIGIRQHVPWTDEAQAWMLAQSVSLPTLLVHSLHYEGTPGLWHLVLKLLQSLHCSFTGARWVAGGIAASGVAVLLRHAPFPRIVRLVLPFSFFLAYQDAVVARSYVLFAVFSFTAAAMLRTARPRPLLLALLLGLMANISLHALVASAGLAVVAGAWWTDLPRRRSLPAAVMLVLFWLIAAATMAPASDVDFSAGNNVWRGLARLESQLGIHTPAPPMIGTLPMAGLAPSAAPVHMRTAAEKRWGRLVRTLGVMTYPLSRYRWLALLLVALVIAQACVRDSELPEERAGVWGLAPYLLMVAVFTSLYLEPRHTGMVFTGFVVAAWLTWPACRPAGAPLQRKRLLLARATGLVFTVVLILQLSWTLHALRSEHTLPYSPDLATAEYLKQQLGQHAPVGATPAAGFYYYSAGPLLYFDHNLYLNQPAHRYWSWSTEMRTYATVEQVLARQPRVVVLGGFNPGPEAEIIRDWQPSAPFNTNVRLGDVYRIGDYFRHHGYHETHLFCGHSWMRASYAEQVCETILERDVAGEPGEPTGSAATEPTP